MELKRKRVMKKLKAKKTKMLRRNGPLKKSMQSVTINRYSI